MTVYDGSGLGPDVPVCCPECQRFLGTIQKHGRGDLVCPRCGVVYRAAGSAAGVEVKALRRTIITEESGEPSLGQVLNRPDLTREPTFKERLKMLLWALLMTGVLLAGLWAAIRYAAR